MTKHYAAVADRIIIEHPTALVSEENELIIPEEVRKRMARQASPYVEVTVIAVGPDCKTVKKGDTVLVNIHATPEIKVDGRLLSFIGEGQVAAVVTQSED